MAKINLQAVEILQMDGSMQPTDIRKDVCQPLWLDRDKKMVMLGQRLYKGECELTDDEARDVVLLPGAHLFSPSEADAIADRIIQEAKAGSEEISTAVLSLLCSRIYYACPTLTDSSASMGITLQRIAEFFKQAEGNFLKSFYDDIIKELKSPAKWYYIEDALVTDEGRRNSVLKSEFDKMVPNSDFLFRGEKSMLRCITTAGTDEPRVEIIHDMLARQMMSSRNERKLQEQAAALRKQRITAIVITY